jgi:hypothetical protein
MAEAIIRPGHFATGPSPYVAAFQQGQQHSTQMGQFREKAELQRQAMMIDTQLKQLELQEKWQMLKTQLAQERKIEGERTKRHEASERSRRDIAATREKGEVSRHQETIAAMTQRQQLEESPEQRRQREMDKIIIELIGGRSVMDAPLDRGTLMTLVQMASPEVRSKLMIELGLSPTELLQYYMMQGQGMPGAPQQPNMGQPQPGQMGPMSQMLLKAIGSQQAKQQHITRNPTQEMVDALGGF